MKYVCLVLAMALSPLWAGAQTVDSTVLDSVVVQNSQGITLSIYGSAQRQDGFSGDIVPVLVVTDQLGNSWDQIVGTAIPIAGDVAQTYTADFVLPYAIDAEHHIVVLFKDSSGSILGVQRLDVDTTGLSGAVYGETISTHIADCLYVQPDIVCGLQQSTTDSLTLSLYADSVSGQPIGQISVDITADDTDVTFANVPIPTTNGLYVYDIRSADTVQLFAGAQRVGPIASVSPTQQIDDSLPLGGIVWTSAVVPAGIIIMMLVMGLIMLAQRNRGVQIIGGLLIALVLFGIGSLVYVWADSHQTDRYTFKHSVELAGTDTDKNNTYWITIALHDNYPAQPTREIAHPVDIVDSNSKVLETWIFPVSKSIDRVITKEIVVDSTQQSSSRGLVYVSGCSPGTDYNDTESSIFNKAIYGYSDCNPPLKLTLPSSESLQVCNSSHAVNFKQQGRCSYAGCTDSRASNYNRLAAIDDGSCNDGGEIVTDITTNPDVDTVACSWLPDPRTQCQGQLFAQTNICTKETRRVAGTKQSSWLPNIDASSICVGSSLTQTNACRNDSRKIAGTGTSSSNCITPQVSFGISTDPAGVYQSCDQLGEIRLTRSDQPIYIKSIGTERVNTAIANGEGIKESTAKLAPGYIKSDRYPVWELQFAFEKPIKKIYKNISIVANGTESQSCDISLLNFKFEEK